VLSALAYMMLNVITQLPKLSIEMLAAFFSRQYWMRRWRSWWTGAAKSPSSDSMETNSGRTLRRPLGITRLSWCWQLYRHIASARSAGTHKLVYS